ncbi:efflux transporter outer membrane subunit [Roseococcus suduntuyensis]|uniref:NodT family efflux transporter outer membrane factor (OMF) lipoprotein n=1 Tax=Roseococcus suduntuyensis TaxID=455361 RepID=A0A840AG78_9PROT|nr:efflux transporter outer membrane subunit [Roseococcus suduntuyensis]MBB3899546.1 NodT family efflux transporter outer membrane factor (OMF) lipoprotein [Roseococcus suduntuyensis]
MLHPSLTWPRGPARSRPARLAAACLGLSVGACAMPQLPTLAPARPLPAQWVGEVEATRPGPRVDPAAWWARFDDPLLDRAVARALSDNLDLAQAAQRVAQARAQLVPAEAQFLPGLGLGAQVRGERRIAGELPSLGGDLGAGLSQPRGTVTWGGGLDASWEVSLFGRATATTQAARAAAAIAERQAEAARLSLAAEVAQTYLELRAAQRRAWLLEASARAQRSLVRLTTERRGAGLASDLDVDRSTSSLRQVEAQIPQARAAATRAARRLATLAADPLPDPALDPGTAEPRQPAARGLVEAGVPADLLRARPDVRAAELAVLRAAAELGVARSEMWPRLTLTGGLQVTATAVGASFLNPAGPLTFLAGGPSLSMPLFDWGVRRANIEARGAALAEATLAYRQSVLGAVEEVEGTLTNLTAQRARSERLEAAEAAALRALRGAERLYAQGLVGFLDRLQAEQDLLQVRIELTAAREAEALAVVGLHKALGAAVPGEGA